MSHSSVLPLKWREWFLTPTRLDVNFATRYIAFNVLANGNSVNTSLSVTLYLIVDWSRLLRFHEYQQQPQNNLGLYGIILKHLNWSKVNFTFISNTCLRQTYEKHAKMLKTAKDYTRKFKWNHRSRTWCFKSHNKVSSHSRYSIKLSLGLLCIPLEGVKNSQRPYTRPLPASI